MTYLRRQISSSYRTIMLATSVALLFSSISLCSEEPFPFDQRLRRISQLSVSHVLWIEFLIWVSYVKSMNLLIRCSGSQVSLWSNLQSVQILRARGSQENTSRCLFLSWFIHNWILNVLNVTTCLWFLMTDWVTNNMEILKEDMYLSCKK